MVTLVKGFLRRCFCSVDVGMSVDMLKSLLLARAQFSMSWRETKEVMCSNNSSGSWSNVCICRVVKWIDDDRMMVAQEKVEGIRSPGLQMGLFRINLAGTAVASSARCARSLLMTAKLKRDRGSTRVL